MNDISTPIVSAFEEKTKAFLVKLLKLGSDIDLKVDSDLIDQIGLDSIEAFDAVASMHELLDVAIPDNFNPKVVNTIRGLCKYVVDQFGLGAAERFVALDLEDMNLVSDEEEI